MDLVARAAPFFVIAVIVELVIDRIRGSNYYRANDAINSMSTGMLYLTVGFFTKLLSIAAWGFVLRNFALIDMPMAWFDSSLRGISLWIIALLAWDFCYYWFHRMSHEISILWAAHAVHHQSEDYNLSTAQRQGSTGFLLGWIFYVPLFVIGFPLEVLLTVGAINLIYQFWVHTQVIRRLGALDRILITPSNHRVHHAQNQRYIDKNYGGILILWDRMFGTFEDERDDEPVVFGVRKPLANWNPFWANLQVYDYLWFDAVRTRRWRDKIGIWFRRTGWRPADMEAAHPKRQFDIARFAKYDPEVDPTLRAYVLFQFIAALVLSLVIIQIAAAGALGSVVLPGTMLLAQLYTTGLLNEGRPSAIKLEILRLVGLNALLLYLLRYTGFALTEQSWIAVGMYSAVSLVWIVAYKTSGKTISNTA